MPWSGFLALGGPNVRIISGRVLRQKSVASLLKLRQTRPSSVHQSKISATDGKLLRRGMQVMSALQTLGQASARSHQGQPAVSVIVRILLGSTMSM